MEGQSGGGVGRAKRVHAADAAHVQGMLLGPPPAPRPFTAGGCGRPLTHALGALPVLCGAA